MSYWLSRDGLTGLGFILALVGSGFVIPACLLTALGQRFPILHAPGTREMLGALWLCGAPMLAAGYALSAWIIFVPTH